MNEHSEQALGRARTKQVMQACKQELLPLALCHGAEVAVRQLTPKQQGYLAEYAVMLDEYEGPENELEFKLVRQEAGLSPSDAALLGYMVEVHKFEKDPQARIDAMMAYFDTQKEEATEDMKPKELREMLQQPMTAKQLRELLQEQNDDTIIVLAADEEGSVLSPLLAVSDAAYLARSPQTGEIKFRKDDEMAYLELRAAKLWHVDDVAKDGDGSVECVVLWPMRKLGDQ